MQKRTKRGSVIHSEHFGEEEWNITSEIDSLEQKQFKGKGLKKERKQRHIWLGEKAQKSNRPADLSLGIFLVV